MELRGYQDEALAFMAKHPRHINALPPGVGKTAISARWLSPVSERVLVVAPLSVLSHWGHELWEWCETPHYRGWGSARHREIARQEFERYPAPVRTRALIVNYEAMRGDIEHLLKMKFDTIVFDEAHRLKNRQSQTFKAARKLARRAERVSLVTGTPILNRADELWALLHCIDPKGYPSFWAWAKLHFKIRTEYFGMRPTPVIEGVLPGHEEIIRAELRDVLYWRPLEDLLPDLPAVIETTIEVQLSGPERKAYESLLRHNWAEMGGDVTITPNAVARNTRLRQLSSDWSAFGEQPGAKVKAAADLISDLEGQVVVFCAYQATCDALDGLLGDDSVFHHGGLSDASRAWSLDWFRAGEARVLVGTAASMGEGVDGLQVAKHVVFVDRDWTPARNEQALARVAGGRALHAVNVWQIVADDTIDQVVADALARKEDVIQAIIKHRSATSAVH